MPAFDSTPTAAAAHEAAYRHLGAAGRLKIAFELSNLVRSLAEAGVRKRNPDYTAEQIAEALSGVIYRVDVHQIED